MHPGLQPRLLLVVPDGRAPPHATAQLRRGRRAFPRVTRHARRPDSLRADARRTGTQRRTPGAGSVRRTDAAAQRQSTAIAALPSVRTPIDQKIAGGTEPFLRWRPAPMPSSAPMMTRMTSLTPSLT